MAGLLIDVGAIGNRGYEILSLTFCMISTLMKTDRYQELVSAISAILGDPRPKRLLSGFLGGDDAGWILLFRI